MKMLPLLWYLQMIRPSYGSDDHIEMALLSPVGDIKSLISTFVLNKLSIDS